MRHDALLAAPPVRVTAFVGRPRSENRAGKAQALRIPVPRAAASDG
ncbi:hypothetical protein ACU4GR_08205 (plasmid) [Methylobacterium oryzae CBMB20]